MVTWCIPRINDPRSVVYKLQAEGEGHMHCKHLWPRFEGCNYAEYTLHGCIKGWESKSRSELHRANGVEYWCVAVCVDSEFIYTLYIVVASDSLYTHGRGIYIIAFTA